MHAPRAGVLPEWTHASEEPCAALPHAPRRASAPRQLEALRARRCSRALSSRSAHRWAAAPLGKAAGGPHCRATSGGRMSRASRLGRCVCYPGREGWLLMKDVFATQPCCTWRADLVCDADLPLRRVGARWAFTHTPLPPALA